jgi:hypothetical protein
MGKKSRYGSGMNIPDHIPESLETIFGLKIPKVFDVDPDPGSGIFLTLNPTVRYGKIRIRDIHPGSTTLLVSGFDIYPIQESFPLRIKMWEICLILPFWSP